MKKISRDIEIEKRLDAYVKGTHTRSQFLQLLNDLAIHPFYLELLETELLVKNLIEHPSYRPTQQEMAVSSPFCAH